ncbi:TlyA family RNA methyltransferase [Mycoplasma sp. (ex Biomphalaria glabrata)]|uniref:TlyA family RNA methyltransferase n=1 Tax=Mycoplasma sp. (ex Biomphalaria glabrata) TaxID=1749074 RepID=UPI000A101831|nr:TlyA family RNA methyltransferase [Mycoplasma sp. (ex Biomphalaria glabrata)]
MKKIPLKRVDELLLEKKLIKEIKEAEALILAGKVHTDSFKITFPSEKIKITENLYVKTKLKSFVSRGGEKLQKALEQFEIDLNDLVCLDVGSSTGGFTDCMLQNGAKKVYSVDSGTNQLDLSLRNNSKVIVMEQYNFKLANAKDFPELMDFIAIDVSFISLKNIFPNTNLLIKQNGSIVALVKPQFEAPSKLVDGGYVDQKYHEEILINIKKYALENNLKVINVIESPILGQKKKNIEYLFFIKKVMVK